MKPIKNYDQERAHLNLARLKKAGEHFEVVIDPEKIMDYRQKKIELKELLLYEKVFAEAKKGLEASDELIKNVFGTDNPLEVAKVILAEGEIQLRLTVGRDVHGLLDGVDPGRSALPLDVELHLLLGEFRSIRSRNRGECDRRARVDRAW